MRKFNNIMIISNDLDLAKNIAMDLWEKNKSWLVLNTTDGYDYDFKHFISDKDKKIISITSGDWIIKRKVNSFIDYCEKYNIMPFFVTNKKYLKENDLPHIMYSNLEEIFEDTTEYIHDEDDKHTYTQEIEILKQYLW